MLNLSGNIRELWNAWELRMMMLLSLFLQILLVVFGDRRKYMAGRWIGVFIWVAYLLADWVASFSLGTLARTRGDEGTNCSCAKSKFIPLFWAPALLAHIGGPATITAYSTEDNELWLRHLLELVAQVSVAFYALLRLWSKNNLPFVAIPIFVVGIIKYGERIWALRLASPQVSRDTAVNEMDDVNKVFYQVDHWSPPNESIDERLGFNRIISEAKFLHEAYFLFQMSKPLFANLLLRSRCFLSSYKIIESKDAAEAFKLIEVELGFVYDVLYTKIASVSLASVTLRCISFLSCVSALVAFSMTLRKDAYSKIDTAVSYILLVGAIILEIYSALVLLFSDWTMRWFSMPKKLIPNSIYRAIRSSPLQLFVNSKKRWSGKMAQHSLIRASLVKDTRVENFLKELLGDGRGETWEDVGIDLKKLIFKQLSDKCSKYYNESGDLKQLLAERGDGVLLRTNCNEAIWSVVGLEFHHSLLVWHIATHICYVHELHNRGGGGGGAFDPSCSMSKSLSNYMMYLLVERPNMLPKGIAEPRYRETIRKTVNLMTDAARHRFQVINKTTWGAFDDLVQEYPVAEAQREISGLSGGCKLAKYLLSLETEDQWSNSKKWEMISQVWVEILIYTAYQCEWKVHAQSLARGGELLTHVRLLTAHLGLSEQRILEEEYFHL